MAVGVSYLALFNNLEAAIQALDELKGMGIPDQDIQLISGVPVLEKVLGRPEKRSLVPFFGMGGALIGMSAGILFGFGTPLLYPIVVGGKPLLSIPPTLLLTFETTMLGLMVFTFLGVLWEAALPSFGRVEYHPNISNGDYALVFTCPSNIQSQMQAALLEAGAVSVERTEAKRL